MYYFGSAHTGGFNGIFADGSIHTLNYDIDVVLFNALATRAGDEVIDESAVNYAQKCRNGPSPVWPAR